MTDLLALCAQLVDVPSESRHEAALTDWIEAELRAVTGLEVTRLGDNVVARTTLGRPARVVLAGHTDTVPANGNAAARIEGDVCWGLGSSDMKSGLAVMLELARSTTDPAVDVTYVFYAREEIAATESGLLELQQARPDLLAGGLAVLGEPTGAAIEAGCQGTIRVEVVLRGARSHPARPWMGRNAVHRAGPLLSTLAEYQERRPVVGGCEYREALQALRIEGGVAGNVVPDEVRVLVNHRFAPDRSPAEAEAHVRAVIEPHLDAGDEVAVVDVAAGATPATDHPRLAEVVRRHGLEVRAKLGWTDVARFSALGVPAVNLGPGDPTLAHTAEERVERGALEQVHRVLRDLLFVDSPAATQPGGTA